MFCEISISIVTLMFASFRAEWGTMDQRWSYGTITIIIILLHGFVSMFVILYQLISHLWLVLQVIWRIIKPYLDYLIWACKRCVHWN